MIIFPPWQCYALQKSYLQHQDMWIQYAEKMNGMDYLLVNVYKAAPGTNQTALTRLCSIIGWQGKNIGVYPKFRARRIKCIAICIFMFLEAVIYDDMIVIAHA
jgi:hypothetical protein